MESVLFVPGLAGGTKEFVLNEYVGLVVPTGAVTETVGVIAVLQPFVPVKFIS